MNGNLIPTQRAHNEGEAQRGYDADNERNLKEWVAERDQAVRKQVKATAEAGSIEINDRTKAEAFLKLFGVERPETVTVSEARPQPGISAQLEAPMQPEVEAMHTQPHTIDVREISHAEQVLVSVGGNHQ